MVRIYIDDTECDYRAKERLKVSFDSKKMVDLGRGRTGYSFEVLMPTEGVNCAVFGAEADIHPSTKFNSEWHPMRVEVDGVTIISGTAYLVGVIFEEGERLFEVQCKWGVDEWAELAFGCALKEVPLEYTEYLNINNVKASWESESPVKFLPIIRDSYEVEGSETDSTGVRRVLTIDDYHPFINLYALIATFFESIGYSVESEFLESELFKSLYMSGNYRSAESDRAREVMGFYAKKAEDVLTTTDPLGRVWMSPNMVANSVGSVADLDTTINDRECYNHGGALQFYNNALIYRPLTSISVGFEYHLLYTTTCKIRSREELQGVNGIDTMNNGVVSWVIDNRHEDQRGKLSSGISYSLMIFDYDSSLEYRLVGIRENGSSAVLAMPDARMTKVDIDELFADYKLFIYKGVGFAYEDCESDWALYFGYVEEMSTIDVDVTVRCSPRTLSPTSYQRFEIVHFRGGIEGSDFTLKAGSSVKPYFAAYPGCNTEVEYSDLAQHQFNMTDVLSSMQHMFNLRLYSDEEAKRVVIEPFDHFYLSSTYDWTHKVLKGESIEHRDWAFETYRSNRLGYQKADGVVRREDNLSSDNFGEWGYSVDSYAAKSGVGSRLNPIFSATTNDDAGLMQVGDRDDVESVDSLNFSPRVARLFGMMEGLFGVRYPYVAFHSPDDDFTLCFEDRDGVEGLNRYYQNQVALLKRASLITLSLVLTPLEWSNLFSPLDSAASLRSEFRFTLKGESFKTRLYGVESYDLESGVARCTFLTLD